MRTIDRNLEILCGACGSVSRLADCFVVVADDVGEVKPSTVEEERGNGTPNPTLPVMASDGADDEGSDDEAPRLKRVVVGSGRLQAHQFVTSQIDAQLREVAGIPSDSGPLPTAVELAARNGVLNHDVAWACAMCLHPLPPTIDRFPTHSAVLAGPPTSSKTATVVSVMEHFNEAGGGFEAFDRTWDLRSASLNPTDQAREYLESLDPRMFDKYAAREPLDRTQSLLVAQRHPPLLFNAQIGDSGFGVSFLDLAGEDYRTRRARTTRAQSLRWAPAVLFFVDPSAHYAPDASLDVADNENRLTGLRSSGTLLSGLIEFIREARAPLAEPPHLFVIVSKADLIGGDLTEEVVNKRHYNDEWVHQVLDNCGAGAVLGAARDWPGGEKRMHWMFLAPMPPGYKAWGVRALVNQLLSSFPSIA
jgi:hypothetical protein